MPKKSTHNLTKGDNLQGGQSAEPHNAEPHNGEPQNVKMSPMGKSSTANSRQLGRWHASHDDALLIA